MTEYFNQFVRIEHGAINSIIVDFLQNKLFHVDNETINRFFNKRYKSIQEFLCEARKEKLIIKIKEKTWIPYFDFKKVIHTENNNDYFTLEIDEGVSIKTRKRIFKNIDTKNISRIITYGNKKRNTSTLKYKEKNFNDCIKKNQVKPWLTKKYNEYKYQFNMNYNSCWGKKIAISREGGVKPCIYSHLSVGNIYNQHIDEIIEKLTDYWKITKDNIEICKDCEFRYLCFDCREYSYIKTNKLYSKNPSCNYNPYTGKGRR